MSENLFFYVHTHTHKGPVDLGNIFSSKHCYEDIDTHVHTVDLPCSHTTALCLLFSLGFYQVREVDSTLIECLESKSLFDSHCRLDVQQSLLRNTVIFT